MLLKLNAECCCCIVNVWEHQPVPLYVKTFVKLTDVEFSFLRTSLRNSMSRSKYQSYESLTEL